MRARSSRTRRARMICRLLLFERGRGYYRLSLLYRHRARFPSPVPVSLPRLILTYFVLQTHHSLASLIFHLPNPVHITSKRKSTRTYSTRKSTDIYTTGHRRYFLPPVLRYPTRYSILFTVSGLILFFGNGVLCERVEGFLFFSII